MIKGITIERSSYVASSKDVVSKRDLIFNEMQESLDNICKRASDLYNMWDAEVKRANKLAEEVNRLQTELSILRQELHITKSGPKPKEMTYGELYSKLRALRNEKSQLEIKIDDLTQYVEDNLDDRK